MSTIKPTTGMQYADMTGKVAAAQVSTASEKSAFNSFSDPAVTPLAPPITNHAAACAGPAIQASASFGSEDQRLLQITQAVVLRADSICVPRIWPVTLMVFVSFSVGLYSDGS